LGSNKWVQIGEGGDAGRVWWQYGSQLAPLYVMSDFDDPPRMQFQQIGSGSEIAPQFQSWIGHARQLSSDIAIWGGNGGIGTATPAEKLEVRGNLKLGANGSEFALGSPDNLRLIAGSVPEAGAAAGNGWTAAHGAGAGVYRVTFTSPFAAPPVVTATLVD